MAGRLLAGVTAGLMIALALPGTAGAHEERKVRFPDGSGRVPRYRPYERTDAAHRRVVCARDSAERIRSIEDAALRRFNRRLLDQCEFRHIQAAIDSVTRKRTNIYVLPGVYRERPNQSRPRCAPDDADEADGSAGSPVLSYREQFRCPHAQNLIAIFGDRDFDRQRECNRPVCFLQIEGTGDDPEDVVIRGGFNREGQFIKLNGIRGDRADGLYLRNFTVELFEFNAVYILETDGFVIDRVVGRYNDEYGFLTFAVDHGLYKRCEGYGNGDSAIYPGSASDVNKDSTSTGELERWAVEIRRCRAHHNTLGYSGTAGNSVYVHHNRFFNNATGIATDSLFPDHPGLPQDHGWFTQNKVYSNNENYYERYVQGEDAACSKPPARRGYRRGVVCPVVPVPVGTGMLIAGGNYNYVAGNRFYDNWRNGVMLFSVPRNGEIGQPFETSFGNHFVSNAFGLVGEQTDPNGTDVWWDDNGIGNCWQDNTSSYGEPTTDATTPFLPDCDSGGSQTPPLYTPDLASVAPCAEYDRETNPEPVGCDWLTTPEEPQ